MENLNGLIEKLFNEFADEHEDFAFDNLTEELVKDAMALAFRAGQNTFDPDFLEDEGEAPKSLIKYPNVTVKLVGANGNAFNLIGLVARAIRAEAGRDAEKEFTTEAFNSPSYDELLALIQRMVNVE